MLLARVDGSVVSTVCHPSMNGWRVLICQPINEEGEETDGPILAIDLFSPRFKSRNGWKERN